MKGADELISAPISRLICPYDYWERAGLPKGWDNEGRVSHTSGGTVDNIFPRKHSEPPQRSHHRDTKDEAQTECISWFVPTRSSLKVSGCAARAVLAVLVGLKVGCLCHTGTLPRLHRVLEQQ